MAVLQSLISLWKRKGKKRKKTLLQHGVFEFGHPPKYQSRRTGLNLVEWMKHVAVLVLLLVRWLYAERIFLISKMRKGIEKHIWYCKAGKVENKKFEEYENENYYLLWWSDNCTFLIIPSVSLAKITWSHGPINSWLWMFSTVLRLLVFPEIETLQEKKN